MQTLNLPYYEQKIRLNGEKQQIFDAVRRRYVALTPEEWVRQNMVSHLIVALHVPATRISVETPIRFNGLSKRCDTVVYDAQFQPLMIVEYKAPTVEITQKTFDQIAVYNLRLQVPYLLVSNGLKHIFCQVDWVNKRYVFQPEIPDYTLLLR
ncbi:MAG: type I restriction enzyme HsdR N-terminal domain-containing protein [Paludibacteraceae bacterium]